MDIKLMDFPSYIPASIKEHFTIFLESYRESSLKLEKELEIIDSFLQRSGFENEPYDSLRKKKADLEPHFNDFSRHIKTCERLINSGEMKEVYKLLEIEFKEDDKKRNFIYAACSTAEDYSSHRDELHKAKEINNKISKVAMTLAELLKEYEKTGVNMPGEFHSISALLGGTENTELDNHNFYMWRTQRREILGKLKGTGYAWTVSPPVHALITTLSEASQNHDPTNEHNGAVNAATFSRKSNPKQEYVRALTYQLVDAYHFEITNSVMHIIAIITNVVLELNNSKISNKTEAATYDDVRKAIEYLIEKQLL